MIKFTAIALTAFVAVSPLASALERETFQETISYTTSEVATETLSARIAAKARRACTVSTSTRVKRIDEECVANFIADAQAKIANAR